MFAFSANSLPQPSKSHLNLCELLVYCGEKVKAVERCYVSQHVTFKPPGLRIGLVTMWTLVRLIVDVSKLVSL